MNTKHTPEPWAIRPRSESDANWVYFGGETDDPRLVSLIGGCYMGTLDENQANAQRIVDCVNACKGMDDPKAEIERLKRLADHYKNASEFHESEFMRRAAEAANAEFQLNELQNRTLLQRIKAVFVK